MKLCISLFAISIAAVVANQNEDLTATACSSWPESEGYSCTDVGLDFASLDATMNVSQTAHCEALCQQQEENGCCHLSNEHGCYWKEHSASISDHSGKDVSVTCTRKENDWKGPTSKIWSDDQCNNLGNLAASYDVDGCKQSCEQKLGCTAFNYNLNGGCTLRECVVPVPDPLSDWPNFKGYYITGNVVEENVPGVGAWGGTCRCPDGSTYQVGDNIDYCDSLACINGEKIDCNDKYGVWSNKKVTCSLDAGKCPNGYTYKEGDVVGAELLSYYLVTITECAELCNNIQECNSLEYAPFTNHCKLNKEAVPNGPNFPSYAFCAKTDPCASVTCGTGFACSNGDCLCGGVSCGTTGNVCNAGNCECGSVGAACTAASTQPACYNTNGAVIAADTTATCWCTGSGETSDTCIAGTGFFGTTPICGSLWDGMCGMCLGDDGMTGTGTGVVDGTKGTCPATDAFCCTDGSCAPSGACP